VLAVLVVGLLALCAVVLFDVLQTVFFAVTVAYVLRPLHRRIVERGLPAYWASALVTGAAFGIVLLVLAAFALVLYNRRASIFTLLGNVPPEVVVPLGGMTITVETTPFLAAARGFLQTVAVDAATAAAVLALKLVLFAIVVFALLVRPDSVGRAVFSVTPPAYHDIVLALDRRVRETLYGIYVLQAATAAGTFVVALGVFSLLGYGAPFTLAVVAAVLQFVPVVGPTALVGGLAAVDLVTGMATRAVLVTVLGLVFVGLAPDAVIRPRLASRTAHLPTSLYFIGFTGGILTLGAVGFIAGPLAVALLVEAVGLLSGSTRGRQSRFAGPHDVRPRGVDLRPAALRDDPGEETDDGSDRD
jgi:predicted PurR-regulated permease PerM